MTCGVMKGSRRYRLRSSNGPGTVSRFWFVRDRLQQVICAIAIPVVVSSPLDWMSFT